MTLTTPLVIPHKAILPNPTSDTWDSYLEHQLVASGCESQRAAQMELGLIAFHALFGEALLDLASRNLRIFRRFQAWPSALQPQPAGSRS